MTTHRMRRSRSALAGLALGLALLGAAASAVVVGCSTEPSATATAAGTIPSSTPARVPASPRPGGVLTPPTLAPPDGLRIPSLGVDAPVVPVGVDETSGELTVPENVARIGWWQQGPAPGSAYGTVVLTGHIDAANQGPGALARLRDLAPGATVTVQTTAGDRAYVVQARREYSKAALPVDVFSAVGAPRLVVISCGGPFNEQTHHYRDNIVVYAVPA